MNNNSWRHGLPIESYGEPDMYGGCLHNFGPYTHMAILLSDVNSRNNNDDNYVIPMSIWRHDGGLQISGFEKKDMIYSRMTGGEYI